MGLLLARLSYPQIEKFYAPLCRCITANIQLAWISTPSYPTVSSIYSWRRPEYYSLYSAASGIINSMHIAQKFERLLDIYR